MMKSYIIILTMLFSSLLWAQKYAITVETRIGGKHEDKFTFVLAENESQFKGFDGKLLAKRYMTNGFPSKKVNMSEYKKDDTKKKKIVKEVRKIKPIDEARMKLSAIKNEMLALENSLVGSQSRIDKLAMQADFLENVINKGERNISLFAGEYKNYLDKFEPVDAQNEKDKKIEAMFRNRPKNTGDIEEIDVGSFCAIKLLKVNGKKLYLNMDYIYSRPASFFYADGNNNGNIILKQQQFERLERKFRALEVMLGKPYCIQFERPKLDSEKTLSDALSQTSIFSKSGKATVSAPESTEKSPFDVQGLYSEIRKEFPNGIAKTARIIISVKKINGE